MKAKRWMTACLILLTLAVYWPVCRYGFVNFDDAEYVYNNPHVHTGFCVASIKYAFTTFKVGNWNPLLWFSFYTDRLLCGLRPQVMHAENVGLHLIGGFILWRLLYVCTGRIKASFVVVAIFLCHPMHVESVAWISERKDVLSTPLLLGAMLAYVNYCKALDKPRSSSGPWILRYLLMIFLFVLSLMVKSMGVTLPAVLLLMDFWPLRRWPANSWAKLVLEKLPLFAISAGMMVLATHSQAWAGAPASLDELGVAVRLENAVVCYVIYIAKLIVPVDLCVYYEHPRMRPMAAVVGATGLLIVVTVLFYRRRRRMPWLLMGWLWFLGTLIPVIGLVQVGGQAMADRYSYLPSIGLLVASVWGFSTILRNPKIQVLASASVLITFALMGYHQVCQWKDTRTLFTHAVNVTTINPVAHTELGGVAFEDHNLRQAIDEYHKAIEYGDNAQAYNGLGNCWLYDDLPRAIGYYRKAVETNPFPPYFHSNLANALRMAHEYTQARDEAEQALKLDPDSPAANNQLNQINREATNQKR